MSIICKDPSIYNYFEVGGCKYSDIPSKPIPKDSKEVSKKVPKTKTYTTKIVVTIDINSEKVEKIEENLESRTVLKALKIRQESEVRKLIAEHNTYFSEAVNTLYSDIIEDEDIKLSKLLEDLDTRIKVKRDATKST